MKILFLTKELPFPINSGARMRTWHYLRGLTQAGAVHLISCSADEANKEQARVFREMGIDVVLDPKLQILKDGSSALSRLLGVFSPLPYAVAAAVYLALTMVIVLVFRKIEKRYAVYE